MPKIINNTEAPGHSQWHSMSRDIFQRMVQGASWFSHSNVDRVHERQPLVAAGRVRTASFNDPLPLYGGINRGSALNFPRHSKKQIWPPALQSRELPFSSIQASVCISDVCRSATPLLPPVPADKEGVSWVAAAFLLLNAALGIGILNFPSAYDQAGGIVSATIIQVLMVGLIIITMLVLAHCSDVNSDVTYHDVLMSMCGSKAQKLAAVSITCTCYGVGVAIFIIIGDQLDRLFLAAFGSGFCHQWFLERHFTIPLVSIIFVLPMCYCKRVDFLRYIGCLGIFAMLYPVFLTVYGYFNLNVIPGEIKTRPDDVSELFAVVPVLCLAYQCQEVVVPVYACLKERNIRNFTKSCFLSMGVLMILYSIIGCCGYLTFGSNVFPNVMKMYNAEDPVVMVGVAALIIKMVVTYPVLALCGRGAVDGLYAELRGLSAADFLNGEKRRRVIIVTVWFSSSLVLALGTSSIGTVIHLLGAVSSANIFIYPGVCLMRVVIQKDREIKKWNSRLLIAGAILLAAFGAFCFGVVLITTIFGSSSNQTVEILCS